MCTSWSHLRPEEVEFLLRDTTGEQRPPSTVEQPELHEMIPSITPEMFAGSPIDAAYQELAPNAEDFPTLVEKLKRLDMTPFAWPPEDVMGSRRRP